MIFDIHIIDFLGLMQFLFDNRLDSLVPVR